MNRFPLLRHGLVVVLGTLVGSAWAADPAHAPVNLIFDTDIGNDVDDVLALGMIHALETRGECKLLAVTITKDHELAAPFVDAINTFYGRGDIPIGVCHSGVTSDQGKFLGLANKMDDGKPRFPHDLMSGKQAQAAVDLLRKTLAGAADHSVVIAQVGFFTNLVGLLESKPDAISPLAGPELVTAKVQFIAIMAGEFTKPDYKEYNVIKDIPSAKKLASSWPTPIVWSGFEIGIAVPTPHTSIERDYAYVTHHPLPEAYILYQPPPHDRPTWDLTAVFYAIRPDRGYFDLSPSGSVSVGDSGITTFTAGAGQQRYLKLTDAQKVKTQESLMILASEPPKAR
ncbi:MAG TPA: nucleoside hydrolase [Planctomycetota bacterium]|nr:nucleoside hydrolase [Planctomycetota bacterium]